MNCRGLTIWELVMTVSLMGILASVAWPVYSGVRQTGEERLMIARALSLEAAMTVFMDRTPFAADLWQQWDDTEKFDQMVARGYLRDRGMDWQSFQGKYVLVWPFHPRGKISILDEQLRPLIYE